MSREEGNFIWSAFVSLSSFGFVYQYSTELQEVNYFD
jgi:hypothetical protein